MSNARATCDTDSPAARRWTTAFSRDERQPVGPAARRDGLGLVCDRLAGVCGAVTLGAVGTAVGAGVERGTAEAGARVAAGAGAGLALGLAVGAGATSPEPVRALPPPLLPPPRSPLPSELDGACANADPAKTRDKTMPITNGTRTIALQPIAQRERLDQKTFVETNGLRARRAKEQLPALRSRPGPRQPRRDPGGSAQRATCGVRPRCGGPSPGSILAWRVPLSALSVPGSKDPGQGVQVRPARTVVHPGVPHA
jgi:hypothetical protein